MRTGAEYEVLQRQVAELSEARPAIDVEPIRQGEWWKLEVTNHGARGIFQGQIEFLIVIPDGVLPRVTAYWEESDRNPKIEILSGQKQRLEIGRRQGTGYEVYHVRHSSTQSIAYFHQAITIKVTISSDPAPIDGPYVGTYFFDYAGLHIIPNG